MNLYLNPYWKDRVRRKTPEWASRTAWAIVIASAVYITAHVIAAVWHIRLLLAWHGH